MAESINISVDLPVFPERVYRAWLDGAEHAKITGKKASIEAREGGEFSAMDGDVEGEILVMTPHNRIVQTWQTKDFPEGSPASQVDINLETTCQGTLVNVNQTGIPDGKSGSQLQWWENNYLRPMKQYFEDLVGEYVADFDG